MILTGVTFTLSLVKVFFLTITISPLLNLSLLQSVNSHLTFEELELELEEFELDEFELSESPTLLIFAVVVD